MEDEMSNIKWLNAGAAAAMVLGTFGAAAPAMARHGDYRGDYYRGGRQVYYNGNNYYRGRSYYRCRNDGAAGTIIGAVAGGLIGNSVAGRHGDRTAGTIIGGAVGALAGRAIDKGDGRC
jgi:outer membrane lipoprotein SlyB